MSLTGEVKMVRQVRPTTVQVGAGGQTLAYDSRTKEIMLFDTSGSRVGKIQPKDVPSGSRTILKSFRVDDSGSIYLLDVFGRRVVVLDKTGVFLRQTAFPKEFGFISDLAVDDRGRVYILDSVRSQVFSAEPEEESFTPLSDSLKASLSYPTHLEVDSKGLIYIVDEETSTLAVLRRDGSFKGSLFNRGRKEGLLYYPSQICVGDGSRIIIADRDNNRVQVFVEKE
jgi:sugar lactone lactonase YvrE